MYKLQNKFDVIKIKKKQRKQMGVKMLFQRCAPTWILLNVAGCCLSVVAQQKHEKHVNVECSASQSGNLITRPNTYLQ